MLQENFNKFLINECGIRKNDHLLLAVSGGVDSVVLTHLVKQAGYSFQLMHCNFQLRGEESERDQRLVESLAETWSVPLHTTRFSTQEQALLIKKSIQETARHLRYEWFQELRLLLADSHQRTFIVTAHHQQDNVETVLMNFFRGTGADGLRGILPLANYIIRPLLFATKADLYQFAISNQLKWVEDSSNASDKYLRNAMRHQLIPLLSELFPGAEMNVASNIHRFRDIAGLYHERIQQYQKKLLKKTDEDSRISVKALVSLPARKTILYELLGPFNFMAAQLNDVLHLLDSETGRYVDSATHRILKDREWLVIASLEHQEQLVQMIDKPENIQFAAGKLEMKIRDDKAILSNREIAQLDANMIQYPLLLRKWKAGDYFYPLGMRKKKKIARFLIDEKLSRFQKDNCWVIEMNRSIIWVVGHRIDDRFKITAGTKKQLVISLVS